MYQGPIRSVAGPKGSEKSGTERGLVHKFGLARVKPQHINHGHIGVRFGLWRVQTEHISRGHRGVRSPYSVSAGTNRCSCTPVPTRIRPGPGASLNSKPPTADSQYAEIVWFARTIDCPAVGDPSPARIEKLLLVV